MFANAMMNPQIARYYETEPSIHPDTLARVDLFFLTNLDNHHTYRLKLPTASDAITPIHTAAGNRIAVGGMDVSFRRTRDDDTDRFCIPLSLLVIQRLAVAVLADQHLRHQTGFRDTLRDNLSGRRPETTRWQPSQPYCGRT